MLVVGTRKGGTGASRNAGNTVLMAGPAITASSNIPVRGCAHMTGNSTGTGRFGVGATSTECNIRNTINVFDARSTTDQGCGITGGVLVTTSTTITGGQMCNMCDRVILLGNSHTRGAVTMTSVTGADGVFLVSPSRSGRFVGVGRISGTLATVGVAGNITTGTSTGRIISRGG